jgi:predicted dehydrogenase
MGTDMGKVLLIGAGIMAQDYIKVLNGLEKEFIVVGRSEENAKKCEEATGCSVVVGGLKSFLEKKPNTSSHAIVAVGVEKLYDTTKELLEYGVKNILVEKPGAMLKVEFDELVCLTKEKDANVLVAYNRRFYASTLKAREIIKEDGGVTSFNFEFTEWSHVIEKITKADGVKQKWFLANSTHVVDLAFYLGGKPRNISTFTSGYLDWHPSASNFSGAGISKNGALFNYQANWESAGRWSVEVLTKEHRLIFRPMEKLQIQKRGTIPQVFDESIDYTSDEKYKPGLYMQTENFLGDDFSDMCAIGEQLELIDIYNKIANY